MHYAGRAPKRTGHSFCLYWRSYTPTVSKANTHTCKICRVLTLVHTHSIGKYTYVHNMQSIGARTHAHNIQCVLAMGLTQTSNLAAAITDSQSKQCVECLPD